MPFDAPPAADRLGALKSATHPTRISRTERPLGLESARNLSKIGCFTEYVLLVVQQLAEAARDRIHPSGKQVTFMNVSVLGPPGCGKGTQAKLLAAHFGLKHFSLGETLRAEIEKGTDLGKRTGSFVKEGKLVPDDLVEEIFESFVKRNPGKGFVLDGYPRTQAQAQALENILKLSAVLLFEVSEEEILSRVEGRVIDDHGHSYHIPRNPPPPGVAVRKREDDQPDVVRKRFHEYTRDIKPIADLYRKHGVLVTVNAVGSIGAVLDQLLHRLGEANENGGNLQAKPVPGTQPEP
jgi:adenylate kinase